MQKDEVADFPPSPLPQRILIRIRRLVRKPKRTTHTHTCQGSTRTKCEHLPKFRRHFKKSRCYIIHSKMDFVVDTCLKLWVWYPLSAPVRRNILRGGMVEVSTLSPVIAYHFPRQSNYASVFSVLIDRLQLLLSPR